VAKVPSLYIDTPCFIDMAKHGRKTSPAEREDDIWYLKQILLASSRGYIKAYTAILTIAECQHADGIVDAKVQRLFKNLLTSGQYFSLVQDTILVGERARDLRWQNGISLAGADGMHVAAALEMGCAEFLTFDKRIHDFRSNLQALGLRVIYPHETQLLPDDFRQQAIFTQ
jgi:predicted nucleic acid-binding protein